MPRDRWHNKRRKHNLTKLTCTFRLRDFACEPRRLDKGLISEVGVVTVAVAVTEAACTGVPVWEWLWVPGGENPAESLFLTDGSR